MVERISRSRVRETSVSTGTGNITLAGAAGSDLAFATVMAVNDTADVFFGTATQWEVSHCKLASTGPTVLQRLAVIENSSNNTSFINFSGGTLDVWMDGPGQRQGLSLIHI